MNMRQAISRHVDQLICEEDLPRGNLKPIRRFEGLYPDDPEEAEAYFDFIRWAMSQDMAPLIGLKGGGGDPREDVYGA